MAKQKMKTCKSTICLLAALFIVHAQSSLADDTAPAETGSATEPAPAQDTSQEKNMPDESIVKVLNLPDLKLWEPEVFKGVTKYETFFDEDGKAVLKADSNQSASGYVRKIKVNLKKTPYINWSWKVDNVLKDLDESTEEGDDYAARIYVVRSGGIFFWATKAVNYVWASDKARGANWPNAFTGNARMVAVESGDHLAGKWITEKRNVAEDFKTLFDIDVEEIDAVAIMTDTDNSKQSATAYYGDIYFSAE